jgi:hypothetical protein
MLARRGLRGIGGALRRAVGGAAERELPAAEGAVGGLRPQARPQPVEPAAMKPAPEPVATTPHEPASPAPEPPKAKPEPQPEQPTGATPERPEPPPETAGEPRPADGEIAGTARSGYHQTEPWHPGRSGAAKLDGADGAIEFAKKHGVEIPGDVIFEEDGSLPKDVPAQYAAFDPRQSTYTADDMRRKIDGNIVVKVRPEILQKDESILAIFGHETKEIAELKKIFADNEGGLSASRLHGLIGHPNGSIHQEAVRYGDELVHRFRASKANVSGEKKP